MKKGSFIFALAVAFATLTACSTQNRQARTRMAHPGTQSSMRNFNCVPHGYR